MADPAAQSCEYAIDGQDTIVSVNDAWLAFARANRAPELRSETVVGRAIWEFISGEPTRELYATLFRRARAEGQEIVLPFRCDSPDRFRFMRLVIAPARADALQLRGVLLREQLRPYCRIIDRAFPRSLVTLTLCSVCLRICVLGTDWIEVEDAVARFGLFDSTRQPDLEYTVCDDCDRAAAGVRPPDPEVPRGSHPS